jgi:hypothetical protein
MTFDHLAIAAPDLDQGAAAISAALGVPLDPGGQHPTMGTHNRLLRLGAGEYLEVIAINPDAPAPGRPRWFDLDRFTGPARPRAWVLRGDPGVLDLPVHDLARGDLRWRMSVPDDGVLPWDGLCPALIDWQGAAHPADRLPDRGVRLTGLTLSHPRPHELRAALAALTDDPRIRVTDGAPALLATFATPLGPVTL